MSSAAADKTRRYTERRYREIELMAKIPCRCGCGTLIPPVNRRLEPARFVHGHNGAGKRSRFRPGDNLAETNPRWNGGRVEDDGAGYVRVFVGPDHPMAHANGYAYEHRLVVASHLGRMLEPQEVVHHLNEIKSDNRIENLMLMTNESEHQRQHHGRRA